MSKYLALTTLAWCLGSGVAHAQTSIVTRCIGSEGYSYYAEGPLVKGKDVGWRKDSIENGSYLVTRTGSDYDVIYTDAANRTVSTREDGGAVLTVADKPGSLVLLSVYSTGLVETWAFHLNESGTALSCIRSIDMGLSSNGIR